MATFLDRARALPRLGSFAYALADGRAAFVVRTDAGLRAYLNLCPHWDVDLDLGFEDFVDPRSGLVTCRNHGAEFDPETGECLAGPCAGASLTPVAVEESLGRDAPE